MLFLLDTTGSMGDELSQLTANIATIADNVAAMAPDADLRFGMTLYRDDVDSFTTATYDLTGDIDAFPKRCRPKQYGMWRSTKPIDQGRTRRIALDQARVR